MSCSSSRRYVRESSPPGSFSSPLSLSLFLSVIGSHLQTVGVRTQQKTARKHPWTADVGSKKASHVLSSPLAFICQRGSYQHLGPISWITVWKLWRGGRGCQLEGTTTDALGTFHKCETVGCQVYTLGIFVSVVPVFRFVFFLIFGQKRKNVQESAETEAVWEIHIFKKKTRWIQNEMKQSGMMKEETAVNSCSTSETSWVCRLGLSLSGSLQQRSYNMYKRKSHESNEKWEKRESEWKTFIVKC